MTMWTPLSRPFARLNTAAVERRPRVLLVQQSHQPRVFLALACRLVAQAGAVNARQLETTICGWFRKQSGDTPDWRRLAGWNGFMLMSNGANMPARFRETPKVPPAQTAANLCSSLTGLLQTSGVRCCFLMLLLLGRAAEAQTACATQHTAIGAFICYPNPSENAEDSTIPDVFHLSAQGNAGEGQVIAGFKVLIDNRLVYESRLPLPIQRLSVETNLRSPFDSGSHTLRFVVDGAGTAEVSGLKVYPSGNTGFCDLFSRPDPHTCRILNIRGPLRWSPTEPTPGTAPPETFRQPGDPLARYSAYVQLYGRNLKSVEADVSDAMAVDDQGNLYVASHAFADVELRKYARNGSLIYASLIRSCGDGFMSVAGLAIDSAGRAWIAGNTNACFSATPNAVQLHAAGTRRTRGFVALVDTTKPGSAAPLYVAYLSDVENRIAAIRVDNDGNAYVAGTTASLKFPHESSLSVVEGPAPFSSEKLGFVAVLNPPGSGLLWSTLVQHAELTALALDSSRNVYITGRVASGPADISGKRPMKRGDVLVAEISDRGRRFSYLARFGGPADAAGRAISTTARGWVLVEGDTDSSDFQPSSAPNKSRHEGAQPFAMVLQPCRTGVLRSRFLAEADDRMAPAIALTPALDAFTTAFSGAFAAGLTKAGEEPASVQIAPACPSTMP